MVFRGDNSQAVPLNIVGSSTFGRYSKTSVEKTTNLYISDETLVPYAGYKIGILNNRLGSSSEGRALFTSTKLGCLIGVFGSQVYRITINYNQSTQALIVKNITPIGQLQTQTGVVYIAENNKPQVGISDGVHFYLYDTALTPNFRIITLNFIPGYLTFHDTYFILAASNDQINSPVSNNTWRLSKSNDGTLFPSTANSVGLLQTKPDNTQAVVRFPSKGNMIFVMGSVVTESWFDTGAQFLFPYQRNNQFNIDYGCLQAATVAYLDEFVVWLGQNEQSGPIILASNGGMPQKLTTDGIDYLFSTLNKPSDSQAFLYRQDGHLFYHINFYTDNLSLVYDFNTEKFYNATDDKGDYFIASSVAFYNNQYYFVSKNDGNLYVLDTEIYTYDIVTDGVVTQTQIPRSRICSHNRQTSQDYMIFNDVGFTVQCGNTDYYQQSTGSIAQITQANNALLAQNNNYFIYQQQGNTSTGNISRPRVDLSMSYDGGASFSSYWPQYLPAIGNRKNKLIWFNLGIANDAVFRFDIYNYGQVACFDGEINVR